MVCDAWLEVMVKTGVPLRLGVLGSVTPFTVAVVPVGNPASEYPLGLEEIPWVSLIVIWKPGSEALVRMGMELAFNVYDKPSTTLVVTGAACAESTGEMPRTPNPSHTHANAEIPATLRRNTLRHPDSRRPPLDSETTTRLFPFTVEVDIKNPQFPDAGTPKRPSIALNSPGATHTLRG